MVAPLVLFFVFVPLFSPGFSSISRIDAVFSCPGLAATIYDGPFLRLRLFSYVLSAKSCANA